MLENTEVCPKCKQAIVQESDGPHDIIITTVYKAGGRHVCADYPWGPQDAWEGEAH